MQIPGTQAQYCFATQIAGWGVCMLVLMSQLGEWEAEMLTSGRVGVFDPEMLIQSKCTKGYGGAHRGSI